MIRMEEIKQEEEISSKKKTEDKKIKNLIASIILLVGLFIGSLFVDMAQIIKGSGYSAKNLNQAEIFEANGKTWVAYSEPAVEVAVISDDTCEKCDVSEALIWLRRVLPTVSTKKIDINSKEGEQIVAAYDLKTLPAFIFDSEIEKTDFYSQAAMIFTKKDNNKYVLKTAQLGMPAGKYLALPEVREDDVVFGNKDSLVKVVIVSDHQCPYCQMFYKTLRDTMKQYQDKVLFVYKHLPLDIHAQAMNASLASSCAQEQGKFWEYSDRLYQNQNVWGKAQDTAKFKEYARLLGLDNNKFNECLDTKKYQDKINADKMEAEEFGIAGTPAIFVNENIEEGAVPAEKLKALIDQELAKTQGANQEEMQK